MKHSYTILACLISACVLHAQNGWLPPVTFPNNTGMCDGTQPKLVLYDTLTALHSIPVTGS